MIKQCNEITYVLKCQDDIYYVGKTKQLHHRLSKHFSGEGSRVTKSHPPVKVVALYAGNVYTEKTLYGRNKYGKNKCFGHCYHEGAI